MMIELPLTPEQEEDFILKMIEAGTIFMDITFPACVFPLNSLDMPEMGANARRATPQDIPRIKEFFDTLKLIEEGVAK